MCQDITLHSVEEVEPDGTVCHIDEFDLDTIGLLDRLSNADGEPMRVNSAAAARITRCDYVKYTDYYRIAADETAGSSE